MAVGVGFPAGVALARLHLGAGQLKHGGKGGGHVVAGTEQAAALAAVDFDGLALGHHVDAGQVGAGLHQGNVLRHGKHAVRHALQGSNQALARRAVDHGGRCVGRLQDELHRGLRDAVLLLDVGCKQIPVDAHGLLHRRRHGNGGTRLAGDGVVKAAGLYVGQQEGHLLLLHIEETGQQLIGVGALLVDVVARVAARQALDAQRHEELALGRGLLLVVEGGRRAATSGTGYEDFALVLRVEVDEVLARHEVVLHALGTRQARLLVAREHALQRTVLQALVGQYGHLHGHADAVVGAQRGATGLHPVAVDVGLDGVAVEVELTVGILLTHHIHVALQNDAGAPFHALGGGLADDDVTRLVATGLQPQSLTVAEQEVNHLFLTLRGARNLIHLCKALKNTRGF